jgi:sugar phosphate isomerase/epimerase
MKLSFSELCMIGGPIGTNVDQLVKAGAKEIELMLDGEGWDGFESKLERIASLLLSKNVNYSIHVPVWDLNLVAENATMRAAVLDAYKRTIEFASLVKAKHVVLHTGWCSDRHFSRERARGRARQGIEELSHFNQGFGQLLLVENIGGPATNLFTQEEFAHFLDGLPAELGYIVDIGHAHLNGWDFGSLFLALGERLHALHLHDNDGCFDSHLPLGCGNIDWPTTLDAIAESGREPTLILEYNIGTNPEALAKGQAYLEAWEGERRLRPRRQM